MANVGRCSIVLVTDQEAGGQGVVRDHHHFRSANVTNNAITNRESKKLSILPLRSQAFSTPEELAKTVPFCTESGTLGHNPSVSPLSGLPSYPI
ncbi:hypothetical protein CEXT_75641 [Caerostris extrusa]|uniref:Uncharacterized protein n=1 Tax=Caerostris extrusa TaxID=172846 RepID=A0AAV4P041_CAEEX|nr:hypothetical protein CEXT_75641 [Caerostris extrusa]